MAKGDFVGEFELYVMLAITHLAEEAYGIAILREIEERTGREVAIGAIYATLGRLGDKGLVRFVVSDSRSVPGGRSRKCYSLTPSGRRALAHSTSMLSRMMDGFSPAQAKGSSR